MEDRTDNQFPARPLNEKFLWLMFFSAIFIYSVVAVIISKFGEGFEEGKGFIGLESETFSVLFYVFLFFAIIKLIILFRWSSKTEHKPVESLPENKRNLFMAKYALADAIAIYGLTLFLINGNFSHLILFSGLAVVGMLVSYPRQ